MTTTDFDERYRADPDPFGVGTRWYERRKQAIVLATLSQERYRLAWDCASGTGHLVEALAPRCDAVLATDSSPEAVRLSAVRTSGQHGVTCAVNALPDVPDDARAADLTLVTEVLYYLPGEPRAATIRALCEQRGELVVVHWRHLPHDAHLSGRAVTHELWSALGACGWRVQSEHLDRDFVVVSWLRDGS